MRNQEVADHLKLISQLKTLNGENHFKTEAYEKAAKSILEMEYAGESIEDAT